MDIAPESGFEAIDGLLVTPALQAAMAQDGIVAPTPIQQAVIGPIAEGKHVVVQSGTGTGKTLAYLLPVLQRLHQLPGHRAVCFAPAPELAVQILRVADRYKQPEINSVALVSGGNQRKQKDRLQKSTRLIVGTAGRILELYAQRKLKGVTTMVLDEAEPILSTKHADYLYEILSRPEPKVQIVFAAATLGSRARQFIADFMGPEVVHPVMADDPLQSRIAHRTVRVADESHRDQALERCLKDNRCKRAIVFVNQPHVLRHLYRFLNEQGFKAVSLSADRAKLQNQQALAAFAASKAEVLLAVDNVATGLDIAQVDWVIHFELPSSAEAYVHRAGRTGRAGRDGNSVVLLADSQRPRWAKMEKELNLGDSTTRGEG